MELDEIDAAAEVAADIAEALGADPGALLEVAAQLIAAALCDISLRTDGAPVPIEQAVNHTLTRVDQLMDERVEALRETILDGPVAGHA
jgi:hypothetical protein